MNNTIATQENQAVRNESQRREQRRWIQPHVTILETKDGYQLEAEMPGVGKEGLEVLLEGNELTIIGRRNGAPDDAQLVYRESYAYDFRRTFELDPAIEVSRIAARMESGVLHLSLPKAEKVKPREIAVE